MKKPTKHIKLNMDNEFSKYYYFCFNFRERKKKISILTDTLIIEILMKQKKNQLTEVPTQSLCIL